jgi:hypothetical protein
VRRNPQHRSLFAAVSAISAPPFRPLRQQQTFATKVKPLYATNFAHPKEETFIYDYLYIESFFPTRNAQQNAPLL